MLEGTGPSQSRIRDSPSVWMAAVLIIVYLVFGLLGGNLVKLNIFSVAFFFVQVNELVWEGWVWMLFTAMFLHADLVHLAGNVFFLLIFGTSLEEQVSRTRWLVTYFASGLAGNLVFLFIGPLLDESPIALGASGAVYGLLGAAGGLKGAVLVILFAGLNLFAGGGVLAHVGGLLVGLALRQWWDDLASLFGFGPSNSQEPSDWPQSVAS